MISENYILKLTVAPQYQLEPPKSEAEIKSTRKVLTAEIIGKLVLAQSNVDESKKVIKYQKCTTDEVIEGCTMLDVRSPCVWASEIGVKEKNNKKRWKNVILMQKYWLLECSSEDLNKRVIQDDDRRYYSGLWRIKASDLFRVLNRRHPAYYATADATSENCVACVYKKNNFSIEDKQIEFKNVSHPITRYVFIKDDIQERIYGPYRWSYSSGTLTLEAQTGDKKLVPREFQITVPFFNLTLGDDTYELASFYGARITDVMSEYEEQAEMSALNSKINTVPFGKLVELLNKDTRDRKKTFKVVNSDNAPASSCEQENEDDSNSGAFRLQDLKSIVDNEKVPDNTDRIVSSNCCTDEGTDPDQDALDCKVMEALEEIADSCLEDELDGANSTDALYSENAEEARLPNSLEVDIVIREEGRADEVCNSEDAGATHSQTMQNALNTEVAVSANYIASPSIQTWPSDASLKVQRPAQDDYSHLMAEDYYLHGTSTAFSKRESVAFSGSWKEPERFVNPDIFGLVKHIYQMIHEGYGNLSFSMADAANIMLCISQNLLTIITGRPGCGKTALVRQLAETLGLTHSAFNRFHEVHVGCDWRSNRDLFGYYNPVSGRFEGTSLYRSLKSYEMFERNHCYPYWVLLDDANMSPLEGYLSDFRSISDIDLISKSGYHIETGMATHNEGLEVSASLRMIATFSDDYSRYYNMQMIHRAWVISLPDASKWDEIFGKVSGHCNDASVISQNVLESLCKAGISELGTDAECGVCGLCYRIYCNIIDILKMLNIRLQKGAWTSIRRYCYAAKKLHLMQDGANMDDEDMIILDYVVSQRILPMVHQSGKTIRASLKTVQDKYGNLLPNSSAIITDIINRGDVAGFYSFFDRR